MALKEEQIEEKLRRRKWLIPLVSIVVSVGLFLMISFLVTLFRAGHYWTILPAGFIAHAFFIILVHDGGHRSITRTPFDSVLMNVGAGMMLVPFYAEPFRKVHLKHHINTNTVHDPLWSDAKSNLYKNRRWFYLLCQLIPLLFTAYVLSRPNKPVDSKPNEIKKIKIRPLFILFATAISLSIILLFKPPLFFVIGTLFVLQFVAAVRHWCEHMGDQQHIESNTFWFPFGMGIGNHDVHHDHPDYSWLTLSVGLFYRKKDTSFLKTLYSILFKRNFQHYKYVKK